MPSAQQSEQDSAATGSAVPPNPFDKHWHVHIDGKTYGPYTGHQIRQMVEQKEIIGSDLVYGEAEAGSKWLQIADDPILGALFKSSEAVRSPLAPHVETSPRSRKWHFAILAVALAGWMVWPYYAVYDLVVAVREGDVSTLETRVAWDKIRQGLRSDLNAVLLPLPSADTKNDTSLGGLLGAGFAAMLRPAMVDRVIESYVTPHGIVALLRANKTDNASPDAASAPVIFKETIPAARRIRWDQIKYAFFSGGPLTFRVDFIPDHDPPFKHPIEFRFQWDGNWKLTRILFSSESIDAISGASKRIQDALGTPLASKQPAEQSTIKPEPTTKPEPPVSQPLQVALVSKSFKSANTRALDFQDELRITVAITNALDKDIRAFDGVLTFTDLLDNKILSLKVAINEPLKTAAVLNWSGSMEYNQFLDGHRGLRNAGTENLKVTFATRKILFADGSFKDY